MHIITLSVHIYIIVHVYFNRFVWYMAFRENFVGKPVFPSVTHHIQVSQVCLRLFEEFVFERGRFRQFLSSLAEWCATFKEKGGRRWCAPFRRERSERAESPTENHENTPTAPTKKSLRNLNYHNTPAHYRNFLYPCTCVLSELKM